MGVLIDTSWLIDVERRLVQDPRLAAELPDEPFVSSITIAELRMGVELSDAAHRRNREAFVEVLVREATIVAFGLDEAVAYGRTAAALRQAGQRIGERDLMIAATALANGHEVLTLNRSEFERVPGLMLREYPSS
ncbi:PIN domain-containing protein [Candidatus Amarobacter glycogenicus]|jgi:predicted nucleic acid-binding protein|uniref:PIN domain-containing protein n=1 Tax=Candidatus Amarobacter glycogenicus TaxID=3140699 RepID=UPI003134B284|nr:PIN domain-containing protein [Dehalococcoidia bacterium]MBK8560443.1 PIN domain-containing protein [Dehalococcoidia bacterium]MBK9342928.1 PIN domain-containing protein [Dehalococcoidia bacterium]MCC6267455.1 PIN domain-containing protein [Dehalococcoidia bacterium]